MSANQVKDGGRGAAVPGFLVGTFMGLVTLTGVSLVAVPVLTVGAMHSLSAGNEQGGGTAAATPTGGAPAVVAAAATAAAGPSPAELGALRMLPPGDADQGEEHFMSYCVACHGPDGKGRPNLGKDLVDSPFVTAQSDAQLILFIKKGRDVADPLNTTKVPMPPKGGNPAFTDGQLNDLVAYMRKLQKATKKG